MCMCLGVLCACGTRGLRRVGSGMCRYSGTGQVSGGGRLRSGSGNT